MAERRFYGVHRTDVRFVSEADFQRYPSRTRKGRMEMEVFDAFYRFAWQARREEIVDIGNLRVKDIKTFDNQAQPIGKLVADLAVHEGRRLGRDAVVFQ